MAKPLSVKDYIIVAYRPGEPDALKYKAVKNKRSYNGNEEIETEEVTIQGRRALARNMKRRKTRLKLARKRAEKRLAKTDVLKKRARRGARNQFADKLAGKGKKKADLTVAKKKQIEKRLKQGGWQQRIAIMQRRMMPQKRRQEIMRKR